jgi:hypothetical protein
MLEEDTIYGRMGKSDEPEGWSEKLTDEGESDG